MLRAFQRSSVIATGAKALASTSVAAQNVRDMSTKKAVIFNLNGALVPAMEPVLKKYGRHNNLTIDEMKEKLFKTGDADLAAQCEYAFVNRHGIYDVALPEVYTAIKGIRAEGIKTGLISDAGGLNAAHMPVDMSLFDASSPHLKADIFDKLKVESSDVVYLDNVERNLKMAQSLGMTVIKVEDVEQALRELEATLQVPLKEFVPGFSWAYWDNANTAHKSGSVLYYFIVLYLMMVAGHYSLKYVFKVDGTHQ